MLKYRTTLVILLAMAVPTTAIEAKDNAPVKVSSSKSFKGVSNILIGSFNIAFINEKTDQAFAGRRGFGGSSAAKTHLEGVSPIEYQAITDAAYADFTERLKSAGYVIADRVQFISDPGIAKQTYVASGAQGTVVYGKDSKAKALYYAPRAFGPTPIVPGEIGGGMFSGFGAVGPAMERNRFAIQNKQAIVNVRYVVDYASAKHRGGSFAFSSSVKLTAQLAVVEALSTVTVTDEKGMLGTLALNDGIAVDGDFGDLADTTTGGQKVEQALGNVIGMLGGIGTASRKFFTFRAEPAAYRDGATEAARRTNDIMVRQMMALR